MYTVYYSVTLLRDISKARLTLPDDGHRIYTNTCSYGVFSVLLVGTSGFSYRDWIGPFYPEGTVQSVMFEIYQQHFNTVEIDYTYYAFPSARTMASLSGKAHEGFTFSVRTHRSMTHEKGLEMEAVSSAAARFREALRPLQDSDKMGCVLLQYPWSFRMSASNVNKMLRTAEAFKDMQVAVEFRNDSWANEEMVRLLRDNGLALCCVDEPRLPGLFPPLAVACADFSYFRFHGRNSGSWWKQAPGKDRYDYDYRDEELEEWIPGITKVMGEVTTTYIYMNNCHMGKAAKNAKKLREKLMGHA